MDVLSYTDQWLIVRIYQLKGKHIRFGAKSNQKHIDHKIKLSVYTAPFSEYVKLIMICLVDPVPHLRKQGECFFWCKSLLITNKILIKLFICRVVQKQPQTG